MGGALAESVDLVYWAVGASPDRNSAERAFGEGGHLGVCCRN